ncbi:MAG: ribose-5-phosphate isomerase RpiA [Candidatus Hadarchaeum sp.]|uniref:ribose-5-phosphate isomerase RpiA n=1 Tax=Candidatus Hadarchaeum sp. TaxID=2883567 RepID=UPI003D0FFCCF
MDTESWKAAAAREAAKLVRDGMVVGLGSGTTVAKLIEALSELRPDATYIAASSSSERLARDLGLKLTGFENHQQLDLTIDGADEVDPNFDLIKGHGGAHTREKIIAEAARRVAIIVDKSKLVRRLGQRFPVPVEVLPFAKDYTIKKLAALGSPLLKTKDGAPFVTDNGNYLVEVWFKRISNAAKLEKKINSLPGVIDNGIFTGLADVIFAGHEDGCTVLRDRRGFLKFLKQAESKG